MNSRRLNSSTNSSHPFPVQSHLFQNSAQKQAATSTNKTCSLVDDILFVAVRKTHANNVGKRRIFHLELVHIEKHFADSCPVQNAHELLKRKNIPPQSPELTLHSPKMHMQQTSANSRSSHIILHHCQSSAQLTHQKHHAESPIPVTCRN